MKLNNCTICKKSFLEFGVSTCIDHMSISIKSAKISLEMSKWKKSNKNLSLRVRSLSCNICMKTFSKKIYLKEHMKVHFQMSIGIAMKILKCVMKG